MSKAGIVGMRRLRWAAVVALGVLVAPIGAMAHGPSRQKVVEQVNISASPATVWAMIKDFNGMPKWHPAVANSTATDGNKPGSTRTLTLKSGGSVTEELEEVNDEAMRVKYRYRGGALPVTNYAATIGVTANGDGQSVVEWKGAFYRGFPNNDPPPELNDEAAVKAITEIYKSGLSNLKRVVETSH